MPGGVGDTRQMAGGRQQRSKRPSPALAVALLALFAAIGGGSAIALRHRSAAPLTWHSVKANPHTNTDPCGAGQTGVFCGAGNSGGFCSFANYGNGFGTAAYAKGGDGIVHLRGSVGPQAGCGYDIDPFVLPAAYRPKQKGVFSQPCALAAPSQNASCWVFVRPNGRISYVGSGNANFGFSLDGITFAAG
jgi:hypothetical protein